MNSNTFDNDATLKLLGPLYQYIVALECCLNANKDEIIYIEQRGDVANHDMSMEVKHHCDEKHRLSDRHEDFWKTLANWVNNYHVISNYQHLVLLTTSIIDEKSKFWNWNKFSKEEKYQIIKDISNEEITKTISNYVEKIFNFNSYLFYQECDLLKILNKFKIKHSHKRIKEKYDELLEHPAFITIPFENRKELLRNLLGYIQELAIENPEDWKIKQEEFEKQMISLARKYVKDEIPLPHIRTIEDIDVQEFQHEVFVKEIEKIDYKKVIPSAVDNYIRTKNDTVHLYNSDIEMHSNIKKYEKELIESLGYEKDSESMLENVDITTRKKASRKFYLSCMKWQLKKVDGILINEDYFQRGMLHLIVDDKKFKWLIEEDDIL